MKRQQIFSVIMLFLLFCLFAPATALAQTEQPPMPASTGPDLSISTAYPGQVAGLGEVVTLPLKIHSNVPRVLLLKLDQIPENWIATFKGGGRTITSVYADPTADAEVDLRLEQPADLQPGTFHFQVSASDGKVNAQLPIDLTVQEKVPPRLTLETDLPTLKGNPTTTFRYNVTLRNDGDEDLTVNLTADAPQNFIVTIKTGGQEVTDLPVGANESKQLSLEVQPASEVSAGSYPITLNAQGGDVSAELPLTAEVTGQVTLNISAPDGRLSGQAYANRETPFKIIVQNTGTADARGIQLSSTEPSSWSVVLDPKEIADIPAGKEVEVTAHITPPDKAVAGDYVVTIRAQAAEGASKSADFRITVMTSTLWGAAGIGLIAVSIGVVAVAVGRFGRR
jgi:uncharacterized membrane protein